MTNENCLIGATRGGDLVRIPLFDKCHTCFGTKQKEHAPETCPICAIRKSTDPNCQICHGTGKAPTRQIDCPDCHGQGRIVHRENAELVRDALAAIGYPADIVSELTRIGD